VKPVQYILLLAVLLSSCAENTKSILKETQQELSKIQSASYQSVVKSWEPYQDEAGQPLWTRETMEQYDPAELYAGCRFITWSDGDIIQCYDSKRRMRTSSHDMTFEVDSLFRGITAYRVVRIPFYQACRRMVDYALTTTDSIELSLNQNDSLYIIDLKIHCPTQVELTMARLDPHLEEESAAFTEDPMSHYQLEIDKKSLLPKKYYRYMSHNYSYEQIVCTPVFNQDMDKPISCFDYIPEGYVNVDTQKRKLAGLSHHNPIGQPAAPFKLMSDEEKEESLLAYKGKTVVLMFTGIGCGPCKAAIPFLNQLVKEQDSARFQLLALECWKNNMTDLKAYKQKYGITYPLLLNGADIQSDYNLNGAVPQFFIINQQGIISAHFSGWSEQVEKEIKEALRTVQ